MQQTVAVAAAAIFAAWDTLSAALAPSAQTAWDAVQSTVQTALAAVQQAVSFATALVVQIWNAHGADILAFAKRTWDGVMSVVVAQDGTVIASRNGIQSYERLKADIEAALAKP